MTGHFGGGERVTGDGRPREGESMRHDDGKDFEPGEAPITKIENHASPAQSLLPSCVPFHAPSRNPVGRACGETSSIITPCGAPAHLRGRTPKKPHIPHRRHASCKYEVFRAARTHRLRHRLGGPVPSHAWLCWRTTRASPTSAHGRRTVPAAAFCLAPVIGPVAFSLSPPPFHAALAFPVPGERSSVASWRSALGFQKKKGGAEHVFAKPGRLCGVVPRTKSPQERCGRDSGAGETKRELFGHLADYAQQRGDGGYGVLVLTALEFRAVVCPQVGPSTTGACRLVPRSPPGACKYGVLPSAPFAVAIPLAPPSSRSQARSAKTNNSHRLSQGIGRITNSIQDPARKLAARREGHAARIASAGCRRHFA